MPTAPGSGIKEPQPLDHQGISPHIILIGWYTHRHPWQGQRYPKEQRYPNLHSTHMITHTPPQGWPGYQASPHPAPHCPSSHPASPRSARKVHLPYPLSKRSRRSILSRGTGGPLWREGEWWGGSPQVWAQQRALGLRVGGSRALTGCPGSPSSPRSPLAPSWPCRDAARSEGAQAWLASPPNPPILPFFVCSPHPQFPPPPATQSASRADHPLHPPSLGKTHPRANFSRRARVTRKTNRTLIRRESRGQGHSSP